MKTNKWKKRMWEIKINLLPDGAMGISTICHGRYDFKTGKLEMWPVGINLDSALKASRLFRKGPCTA